MSVMALPTYTGTRTQCHGTEPQNRHAKENEREKGEKGGEINGEVMVTVRAHLGLPRYAENVMSRN